MLEGVPRLERWLESLLRPKWIKQLNPTPSLSRCPESRMECEHPILIACARLEPICRRTSSRLVSGAYSSVGPITLG